MPCGCGSAICRRGCDHLSRKPAVWTPTAGRRRTGGRRGQISALLAPDATGNPALSSVTCGIVRASIGTTDDGVDQPAPSTSEAIERRLQAEKRIDVRAHAGGHCRLSFAGRARPGPGVATRRTAVVRTLSLKPAPGRWQWAGKHPGRRLVYAPHSTIPRSNHDPADSRPRDFSGDTSPYESSPRASATRRWRSSG
jgi:hypothetical protein